MTLPLKIQPMGIDENHREVLYKVPEITLLFWVVKLLTTAMGEATSDYLVSHINPYVAVLTGAFVFLFSIILQFSVKKYIAWIYWFVVAMVSVFGTMVADSIHVALGIPYIVTTPAFLAMLIAIFVVWKKSENTLSIHSIYRPRREMFYWAAVLATFALGTAAGDMTASSLDLGYFISGVLFAILFLLPGLAYRFLRANPILAFWLSYIMTRPLGASFADWADKPKRFGGLGYGTALVSVSLTAAIIACVTYMALSRKEDPNRSPQSVAFGDQEIPSEEV